MAPNSCSSIDSIIITLKALSLPKTYRSSSSINSLTYLISLWQNLVTSSILFLLVSCKTSIIDYLCWYSLWLLPKILHSCVMRSSNRFQNLVYSVYISCVLLHNEFSHTYGEGWSRRFDVIIFDGTSEYKGL